MLTDIQVSVIIPSCCNDEEKKMSIAKQIRHDYRGHLDMMLAEAKTWGDKEEVMVFQGYDEFPVYAFQDGSALEFKVRHGFAHEVRVVA